MKTLGIYFALSLVLATAPCFAVDLPDIAFTNSSWKLPAQADIDRDILRITGNDAYQLATLAIAANTVDPGLLYVTVEMRSRDLILGKDLFTHPKIRIDEDGPGKPAVINLELESDGEWHQVTLSFTASGKSALTVAIGMQNCRGTLECRNPRLTREHPPVEANYPFTLPATLSASLVIDTSAHAPLSSRLLGVNQQFTWSPVGYGDAVVQEFIAKVRPPSLRFPGGTVANYYDWTTDSLAVPAGFSGPHVHWITTIAEQGKRFDFPAYAELCKRLAISSPITFNILGDSIESSVLRFRSYLEAGLVIEHIELGNENYFLAQRGGRIPDVAAYIAFGKQLAAALRTVDASIPIAVNITGENLEKSASLAFWNEALAKEDFYDAVVLHPYLSFAGARPDTGVLRRILHLRPHLLAAIAATRETFGDKPILLSEWGILGDDLGAETVCASVAIADGFLTIIDAAESGTVRSADLHMLCADTGAKRSGVYGLDDTKAAIRTSRRGAVYELVLEAFREAELFSARCTSTSLEDGLPAVSARAVRRADGSIAVLAVNLANRSVRLAMTIDGVLSASGQRRSYVEAGLAIGAVDYPLGGAPFQTAEGSEAQELPPLSVNLIVVKVGG